MAAQYLGDVHVGLSSGLLGDGDDVGANVRAGVSRDVMPRVSLAAGAGYMNTTDRAFDPERPWDWQYREVVTLEAALHVDVFRMGGVDRGTHAVGVEGGGGWLRQWREAPFMTLSPAAVESQLRHGGLDAFVRRGGASALHLFATEEGPYAVYTVRGDLSTVGWLAGLYYTFDVGRLTATVDAAFRRYRSGATLLDYGVWLGYRIGADGPSRR